MSRRTYGLVSVVLVLALVPVAQAGEGMTDAQAVAFLKTGKGLPGLDRYGSVLPARRQTYALRMYRTRPYRAVVLNLFYAVSATGTHFGTKETRASIVASVRLVGRERLISQTAAGIKPATTVTRYGVTVRQAAAAMVHGMLDGAAA